VAEARPPAFAPTPNELPAQTLLRLQRTAGNAAVGRLLRSPKSPVGGVVRSDLIAGRAAIASRVLQREPLPTLDHPDANFNYDRCGWLDANDVRSEIERRDVVIRDILSDPRNITDDNDVRVYLKRWLVATECMEIAIKKYFSGDRQMLQRMRDQYTRAVELITLRGGISENKGAADVKAAHASEYGGAYEENEVVPFLQADRFDRLDPTRFPQGSNAILSTLNPYSWAFRQTDYCKQNCPAAASKMQKYLLDGELTPVKCDPRHEVGYVLDPDSDTWGAARAWAATFNLIKGTLKKHGDQVIVEGDRGAHNDAGLTQWHYFCVVNIHGTLYVADAFSGMVRADIQAYTDWLKTRTYKFTTKRVEALTMEEWKRRNP
jgi:hypothetical protein